MASYHDRSKSNAILGDASTGTKLRRLMDEKNMSQIRLSRKSGVAKSTIRRMCNGDMIGTFDSWVRVLRALDADANDFIGTKRKGKEDGEA